MNNKLIEIKRFDMYLERTSRPHKMEAKVVVLQAAPVGYNRSLNTIARTPLKKFVETRHAICVYALRTQWFCTCPRKAIASRNRARKLDFQVTIFPLHFFSCYQSYFFTLLTPCEQFANSLFVTWSRQSKLSWLCFAWE